jgi:serine/threonine-protein kinase
VQEEEPDENEMRRRGRTSKKVTKRRSSRSMLPIISGVTFAFIIVVAFSALNIFWIISGDPNESRDNTVQIPDFTGMTLEEALAAIDAKERVAAGEIRLVNDDNFEENQIIEHSPAPHEVRRWQGNDIRIDLRVSKGRYAYFVGNLAVLEARSVQLDLESRGIRVEIIEQMDDFVPMSHIITTDPGPGSTVRAGETIRIYVSSGQEIREFPMPNLVGELRRDALRTLEELGIGVSRISMVHSDDVPAERVIEQSIGAFRPVRARSARVELTVSMGPEPPPESETGSGGDPGDTDDTDNGDINNDDGAEG